MTSRNLTLPYFPTPPREYSQAFFAEFLRAFSIYMEQARNPGEGRATFIVLTNLQTNDAGLEPGAIFRDGNILRIAMSNMPFATAPAMSASVGAVSVTT